MSQDLNAALESFQHFLRLGQIWPQRVPHDPELYAYSDNPDGGARITYVQLDAKTVTAFACAAPCGPVDGVPCFKIGYAVPQALRNQGRAKKIVAAALAEMQRGFGRNGVPIFYVEAIVAADDLAAQRVAEQTIAAEPVPVTDETSGLPALRYIRKIGKGLGH